MLNETNNKEPVVHHEIENVRCVICRHYNDKQDDGPITWLLCDDCNNCVHKLCALKCSLDINSVTFKCPKCLIDKTATVKSKEITPIKVTNKS